TSIRTVAPIFIGTCEYGRGRKSVATSVLTASGTVGGRFWIRHTYRTIPSTRTAAMEDTWSHVRRRRAFAMARTSARRRFSTSEDAPSFASSSERDLNLALSSGSVIPESLHLAFC